MNFSKPYKMAKRPERPKMATNEARDFSDHLETRKMAFAENEPPPEPKQDFSDRKRGRRPTARAARVKLQTVVYPDLLAKMHEAAFESNVSLADELDKAIRAHLERRAKKG